MRGTGCRLAGYGPWMYLGSTAKREQLLNVADWFTQGQLPVRVHEMVKLMPLVRLSADRKRGAVVLLNVSTDAIDKATIDLRIKTRAVELLSSNGRSRKLDTHDVAGNCRLALARIAPWPSTILLIG